MSKIGEGFFGEVWRAKWNRSQDVACKKMKHQVTSAGDVS
jgi:serine/threonine protein kinase